MKKFRELTEAKETVVFAYGRFNPPTTGHEKLIKKVASVAGSNPYFIYPSHTQNPKKDPLPQALKIAYMRKMFKGYSRKILATKSRNAIEIAVELYDKGYKNLVMVVGSDRVKVFDAMLSQYNGVEGKPHGYYKFDSIKIENAGERDPDSEGVEGMSASKMRSAAADGDKNSFLQGIPSGFRGGDKLYRDVRKYMGIREEKDMGDMSDFEYVRDQYLIGKIWNVGDVVEVNDVSGEVVRKGTNYLSFVSEDGKVHKAWLHEIETPDVIVEGMTMMVKNPKTKKKMQLAADQFLTVDGRKWKTEGVTKMQVLVMMDGRSKKVMSKQEIESGLKAGSVKITDLGKVWQPEGFELEEAGMSALDKLKKFDKDRIGGAKIFKDKGVEFIRITKKGQRTIMNVPADEFDKWKKKGYEIVEGIELDERNYAKEYANYQGKPEQIARRSSRNKARRVMGDKTKLGMDVGHKDNNPMNNDPKNLRNENPSKNRREPRLRSEAEIAELAWHSKFYNWVDTHAHKKGFDKLAKQYVDLMKSDKKYRDMPTRAINDVARKYQGVSGRELSGYINDLIKKGILPQELKADFDPSEAKIFNFKDFIDQINNK